MLSKEPALILGAVVSILQFVVEAIAGAPSWEAALPLLAGAIIRRFVSPVGR